MLRDLQNLQAHYTTGQDSLLDDFYVPCLKNSHNYDRATGYFSSALYAVTSAAYSQFISRGGTIRLITSPQLSGDDVQALAEGATARDVGDNALRTELALLLERPETAAPTRLLATMVATGVLDLRVALQPGSGIFHDKVGIFRDEHNRQVAFIGSANETFSGWGANHESIEVFASWEGTTDLARVRRLASYFERLWAGTEGEVEVHGLTEEMLSLLRDNAYESMEAALAATAATRTAAPAGKKILMDYQSRVLRSWELADYHGIVSFATGAGKTITALEGIRRWADRERGGAAIVIVPSADLHKQWAREIRAELPEANLILAGAGHSEWRSVIRWALSDHAREDGRPRIVLTTNKTFASSHFQQQIASNREDLLLVADELHRTGSAIVLESLQSAPFKSTLGLSATYARQFDENGTQSLIEVYGQVLEPVIGLTEAILLGRLVPYDYFLHRTSLDDQEQEQYDKLTTQIKQIAAREHDAIPDSYLQMLLIKRARILKQARSKVPAALEVLQAEYQDGDRWLVYCDDATQLERMIALCLEHRLPALEYHSQMAGNRDDAMASFTRRGGIMVAIRCLDEGIDIPACDKALILASSTVEREYIQRRGRVLRTSPDKFSAAVHDLLLVDEAGGVLTRGEALRALEFARLARNEAPSLALRHMLALSPDFGAEVAAIMEGSEDE